MHFSSTTLLFLKQLYYKVCDTVDTGVNLSLLCPAGQITSIDFASYGTPTGRCGAFGIGSCSMNSTAVKQGIEQS